MKKIKKQFILIGGGLLKKNETLKIDKYIIKATKKKKPRVVFIPIASNDMKEYIDVFKSTYQKKLGCEVCVIKLSDKNKNYKNIEKVVLKSDLVYFGGGDINILLKYLQKDNLQKIFKNAYDKGIVICGLSAGCAIWYKNFIENKNKRIFIKKGLGWINETCIPHFNANNNYSKKTIDRLSKLNNMIGIENNCAIHYINEKIIKVITSQKTNAFSLKIKNKKINTFKI